MGRATAIALRGLGWTVFAVARRKAELDVLAAESGAIPIVADVADPAQVTALKDAVLAKGTPDVVIHGAGAGRWLRTEDTDPAEARQMLDVPLYSNYLVTHAFLTSLLAQKTGQFIHINSPAGYQPWPHSALYAASRGGVRSFHEALRQDLAGSGLRSSHITFGKISSGYFDANPGVEDRLPGIGKTLKPLSPETCADEIIKLINRPRHEVIKPGLLRLYVLIWHIWPTPVRWLMRITAKAP